MKYKTLEKQIDSLPTQYVSLIQNLVEALSEKASEPRKHLAWLEERWGVKDDTETFFSPWKIDGGLPTREELHER